jgi:hypothetical protein
MWACTAKHPPGTTPLGGAPFKKAPPTSFIGRRPKVLEKIFCFP